MGDFSITKAILKIKPKFQKPLKAFIDNEKSLEFSGINKEYINFWNSLGVNPFPYSEAPFSQGYFHVYSTSLGSSEIHKTSDFYIPNSNFTTKFEDGLWFVEFSYKTTKYPTIFMDSVVPKIADAWIGLYGDEYHLNPTKYSHHSELISSSNIDTQNVIDNFLVQYNKDPVDQYTY